MSAGAVSNIADIALTDIQSGYRLITVGVLQGLQLGATGYEGELELLLKACKRGHTVVDISVATHYIKKKALRPFPVGER